VAKTKEAITNEEAPSQHAPVIDVIKEVVSKEVTEGEKCVNKRKNAASSQSGTLGMTERRWMKKQASSMLLRLMTNLQNKCQMKWVF